MSVHFMSERQDWGTPPSFLKYLKDEMYWVPDLDAAASKENAKAPAFFDVEMNGLEQRWFGNVWLNPPFGRDLPKWIGKCIDEIDQGRVESIVALVPARTETVWAHDAFNTCSTVFFIKGRFDFRYHKATKAANAPFPSMLLVWRKDCSEGLMMPLDVPIRSRKW
jgi:phage N-6-adenine-methyltransferase